MLSHPNEKKCNEGNGINFKRANELAGREVRLKFHDDESTGGSLWL